MFTSSLSTWRSAASRFARHRREERLCLTGQYPGPSPRPICASRHPASSRWKPRGHLAEFGLVVPQGPANLNVVVGLINDRALELPDAVRDIARLHMDQIDLLTHKVEELHSKLVVSTKVDDAMRRRLCTVPCVGPVTAKAIMAFAPDLHTFASGRKFTAWLRAGDPFVLLRPRLN